MKQKLTKFKYRLIRVLKVHQAFVVVLALLVVLIATVLHINKLSNQEADQAYIDEQTLKIQPVRFNQSAIEKIEALRDSNVSVPGTELPKDRQNPFGE